MAKSNWEWVRGLFQQSSIAALLVFVGWIVGIITSLATNLILKSERSLTAALFGGTVLLIIILYFFMVFYLTVLKQIESKFRFRVTPQITDPAGIYRASKAVIEQAKPGSKIYAVNYFAEMIADSELEKCDKERKAYFSALERVMAEAIYIRIIQLPDEMCADPPCRDLFFSRVASSYLDHYAQILKRGGNVTRHAGTLSPKLFWAKAIYTLRGQE